MPRIRSLHPGFFTDEKIVTISPLARLLFLGVLTECDDNGVFEWKPITLKMRLFPIDAVDVAALLAELIAIDAIARVEIDGRECGAVRNFCKFQRPKKPHVRLPVPDGFRLYVGINEQSSEPSPSNSDASGEPVPHQLPTGSPFAPQMEKEEDLGGKEARKNEDEDPPSAGRRRRNGKYAFEAGVIRLNAADLEKWRMAYPNVTLEAELLGLAEWAGLQKNWFHAVPSALAKKQREAVLAIERVKAEAAATRIPEEKPRGPLL